MVSVHRGSRFFERMHWAMWSQRRQSLLETFTFMTAFLRLSTADVQRDRWPRVTASHHGRWAASKRHGPPVWSEAGHPPPVV